jgi:hypothetical protein
MKPTCSHCGLTQQGYASLSTDGIQYPLCHPDDGMDCYRLVTVYRHAHDGCAPCMLVAADPQSASPPPPPDVPPAPW